MEELSLIRPEEVDQAIEWKYPNRKACHKLCNSALPMLCDFGQGPWSCFHLCKMNTAQSPYPVLNRP